MSSPIMKDADWEQVVPPLMVYASVGLPSTNEPSSRISYMSMFRSWCTQKNSSWVYGLKKVP